VSHLFLLGGSGRVGGHVIDYALTKDHTVTALVRDPTKVAARPGLTLIEGTPLDAAAVGGAMRGATAVIVALNSNRSPDTPFGKPVSPPRLMADSVAYATAAMATEGIRRIVVVSAFGVGDSLPKEPLITRLVIGHTNLGYTYADHNLLDQEIRLTDTDWTLLRPAALNDKPATGKILVTDVEGRKPKLFIGREDVAHFAVDVSQSGAYIHQAPIISRQ
jgi:uncharacterized protein YbjT (DUF2867 family)